MPKLTRARMDLEKLSSYSIIINSLQVLAALAVALLAMLRGERAFNGWLEQLMLMVLSCIVISGAVVDVRDAFSARRVRDESNMLEAAYDQLSHLNSTLRAQRHDFMNHLQVVYSLMEMQDYQDAQDYIETVYVDIQRVSRTLKTSIPALNALLASKLAECEQRHVEATINIASAYGNMPVPDWELCRVFSNLIDNALDAMKGIQHGKLIIETNETLHDFSLSVINNGPEIPKSIAEHIFNQGFSTKGNDRGMGLSIVSGIIESHGGKLLMSSNDLETRFDATIPKQLREV